MTSKEYETYQKLTNSRIPEDIEISLDSLEKLGWSRVVYPENSSLKNEGKRKVSDNQKPVYST